MRYFKNIWRHTKVARHNIPESLLHVPAHLEDEHLGYALERGEVLVVEELHHVAGADEAAVVAAEVVVAGVRARVPVRRHHDEQALRAAHHLLQAAQGLQRLLEEDDILVNFYKYSYYRFF